MYLSSVQQMVSGELAGECLQRGFERHGLHPQRAPLDTVCPLREHLNSVQRMVSGGYCEGLSPDTVCWTRIRNTWYFGRCPELPSSSRFQGVSSQVVLSMPDMTGRPGCRTMEMFGESTASYLARTPRIPFFVFIFIGLETKNVLDYQGRAGSTCIVQWTLRSGISKPVVWGMRGLHPGFPWFSSFSWFP